MDRLPSLEELNALLSSQNFKTVKDSDSFMDASYTVRVEFIARHTRDKGIVLSKEEYSRVVCGRMKVGQLIQDLRIALKAKELLKVKETTNDGTNSGSLEP